MNDQPASKKPERTAERTADRGNGTARRTKVRGGAHAAGDEANPVWTADLEQLEQVLGHVFTDRSLLISALTHRSFANDHQYLELSDYQRLEFLGDAVVGCVVADLLYRQDPKAREGVLTLRRASMVKEERLADAARSLGLKQLIRVGQGEEASEFPDRDSVLSDVFEAVIAAIWLDAGAERLARAEALMIRVFADDLATKSPTRLLKPPKSRLQELSQARWKLTPRYVIYVTEDEAQTTVELTIGDQLSLRATGTSRKTAENRAAEQALAQILGEPHP